MIRGSPHIVSDDSPRKAALLREIDNYLTRLNVGSIAFNTPQQMQLGDTTEIRLLLSATRSVQDLPRELEGLPGVPSGTQIRIAPQMDAELTGRGIPRRGV